MEVVEVLSRDAIPSIDAPEFDADYFGEPEDAVIVFDGTPPRAYPIRILSYHEIVNDVVDGRPVAVTWCPICWSAVVYERVVDDRVLTFGVSGKLADDTLVMYDRETGSEWKQSSGECLRGEFEGRRLTALSSAVTTWGTFREAHPAGVVLQPARADARAASSPGEVYEMAPYERYRSDDAFGLVGIRGVGRERSWGRDDLDAKTLVLGIDRDDEARGYPRPWVQADGGVVADRIGTLDVVVFCVAGELAAFEDPGIEFTIEDGVIVGDGATWDHVSGRSDDGRRLEPVPARQMFAFTWVDDHGPDALYAPSADHGG